MRAVSKPFFSDRSIAAWPITAWLAAAGLLVAGCTVPSPYRAPGPPPATSPPESETVQTQPGEPPSTVEEPQPLPAPVVREPTLGAASRALVNQAQAQVNTRNYPVAVASIERALRIEPDNPLLWIELGKVRLAEGNYVQAENTGRKALTLAANAPRAQSSAWRLVAESYRARGQNTQAQEAQSKADAAARQ